MTLKIQSDGTRFAFFNFQNLRAADTGMKKLENFRVSNVSIIDAKLNRLFQRCMLASGDLSLFENYTKIRYSDRRPIPTRLDECRSEVSDEICWIFLLLK